MVFRNKKLKTTAVAIAILTLVSSATPAFANENNLGNTSKISIEKSYIDGKYDVKNDVVYVNASGVEEPDNQMGNGSARGALENTSKIEIKGGKIYLTVTYTKMMHEVMSDYKFNVDGKDVNYEKDGQSYTFELNSIDSKVIASSVVSVMGRSVKFRIINDTTNIPTQPEKPVVVEPVTPEEEKPVTEDKETEKPVIEEDKDTEKPVVEEDKKPGKDEVSKPVTDEAINKVKDGKYKIQNNVSYIGNGNSQVGNESARKVLDKTSIVEVKNNKARFTLTFTKDQYAFLDNFRVSVDGKNVNVDVDKTNRTISFDAASINSEITVTVKVTIMGRDVSFKTSFDKSTMEMLNTNTSSNNNEGKPQVDNNINSNKDKKEESKVEKTVKKGKLYTIKNTVNHESQVGKEMARKYLNSTSNVEIIDGETFVTLTFTGSSFMKNHSIYVNGAKVSHQVTSKSGDSVSLRFKVSNLSDTIKVGAYVIPMSREIDFTVSLLKDSLTFVKDFETTAKDGTSLPQTGSAIDSTMTLGAGSILMAVAGILKRKRK